MKPERVVALLEEEAGDKLDPEVVEIFLSIYEEAEFKKGEVARPKGKAAAGEGDQVISRDTLVGDDTGDEDAEETAPGRTGKKGGKTAAKKKATKKKPASKKAPKKKATKKKPKKKTG